MSVITEGISRLTKDGTVVANLVTAVKYGIIDEEILRNLLDRDHITLSEYLAVLTTNDTP